VLGFGRSSQDYSLVFEQAQLVLITISRGACQSCAAVQRAAAVAISSRVEYKHTINNFFFEKSDKIEKSKSLMIEN
jgi:Fe-S cluster biogenesis protein NfuA